MKAGLASDTNVKANVVIRIKSMVTNDILSYNFKRKSKLKFTRTISNWRVLVIG